MVKYKDINVSIDITTKKTLVQSLDAVVYSHDSNAVRVIAKIAKNGAPLDTDKVSLLLSSCNYSGYVKDGVSVKLDGTIVDDTATFELPNDILSYQGFLRFDFYIDWADGSNDGGQPILFEIKKSTIDAQASAWAVTYISDFEQIKQQVSQAAQDALNAIDTDKAIAEFEADKQAVKQAKDTAITEIEARPSELDTSIAQANQTIDEKVADVTTTGNDAKQTIADTVASVEESQQFSALTQALAKVNEWNGRIDDVEQDYANRAEALEETYAPRLTEVTAQLEKTETELMKKPDKNETGWATLNSFDEPTRAAIQGIQPGKINAVLGEGNVEPFNTNFFQKGTNLYNPATTKSDVFYHYASGNEQSAAGFFGSGFIPVEPNEKYFIRTARHIVFSNPDGSYLSGVNDTTAKNEYVVTIPENVRRMRVSWKGTDNQLPQQVNKGDKALPYEPYREYIPKELTEAHDINPENIPDITIDKLSFSKMKSNRFDKSKAQIDKTINNSTGGASTATGFVAYENMPVESGGAYTIKCVRSYAWKDSKGVFVSGSPDIVSKQNATITAPTNAKLLSFSWYPPADSITVEQQQVNEGAELLPYEEYGYYIPSQFIENETGSGKSGVSLKLNLPPEIYAVTGKEVNIYFDNIANLPLSDYQVDVTCSIGKQMSDKWTATPTGSGNYPITITVYKDFEVVAQVNSTVKVKTSAVGIGIKKYAIIVGDSTIAQDFLINHLEDTFGTDPLTINFKGTRGTYGELHNEGYAGWKVHDLRTNKTYKDVVHPFYNPIKADFDFAYYMTNQGYTGLDYVVLCFGINDTFSFTNDSTLLNKIPDVLTDFDYIINNIHAYDSNIKIGVCVTIPPNANQDAFGNAYYTGQTQWRYKRNNALWIEQLINAFKGKTPQNIYLVPDNSGIDATIGFRDGVHPNQDVGDKQRADTFYSWFKSFEV